MILSTETTSGAPTMKDRKDSRTKIAITKRKIVEILRCRKKKERKRKKIERKKSARLLFHGIEEIDFQFDLLSIYSLTLFGIGFCIAVRDIRSEASNRRWETVSGKSKGEGSKVGRTMMDEESFREEAVGSCGEDY